MTDILYLCNYMLVTFSLEKTPLMKILTGLEIILNKIDEWEIYASKTIGNSCEAEALLLKQLIIRFRKIQILSWKNILTWKKRNILKKDTENLIRFYHTVER